MAVPRSQGDLDVRVDQFAQMTDKELDDYIATAHAKMAAAGKNPKPGGEAGECVRAPTTGIPVLRTRSRPPGYVPASDDGARR